MLVDRAVRTVGVILAGNFQQCGECLVVFVNKGSNFVGNMLVDEHNGNVAAILGEAGKCLLNIAGRRLIVHDKEVLVALLVHVANASKNKPRGGVLDVTTVYLPHPR